LNNHNSVFFDYLASQHAVVKVKPFNYIAIWVVCNINPKQIILKNKTQCSKLKFCVE